MQPQHYHRPLCCHMYLCVMLSPSGCSQSTLPRTLSLQFAEITSAVVAGDALPYASNARKPRAFQKLLQAFTDIAPDHAHFATSCSHLFALHHVSSEHLAPNRSDDSNSALVSVKPRRTREVISAWRVRDVSTRFRGP
ncbi:hypothetical protein M011DRAFT_205761 [Sporormia fimetaria CBS 119925]|uniref:Uncharacterized protein n=1 Tax=Sporormia fimetaria CBS 119925 TaxID=1340428 RepID=A0A6A6V1P9_9PLEO|nr:hypothetical protein M011DRAFT_205761 [Sporormia fimetaria CBS 119925]